ncbi:tetratricopeptide repeat protein [Chromobacterium sp. IIBBL 290-4]|uniref:tetratricopeptide repeat protein n=1 Tax=Chromobacterium sp. IIBBL 290-4 TaxID=2953890 RepID=UPI0020B87C09|nr:tetratricopeptide repeat protein [Chromobacterium sp. IIBBL 290-4]UTH75217.1 tetratricopeptide repeat protein [Chromobacterium sp. IIBBL 290-4]
MHALSTDALTAGRLLGEGKIGEALQWAQRVLLAEPDNAPVWNLLGVCAARLGQSGLAEQCWGQALALDAATPDAQFNLGCLREEQNEPALAEACYRAELARDASHAASLGNLGNLLQNDGRLEEAEGCYRRQMDAQPEAANPHFNLGRLQRRLGRLDEAAESFRQSLARQPDDAEALQLLGQLSAELGQAEQAELCLRRALALDSGHLAALNNLGLLLTGLRRWEEAERLLRQAFQQSPAAVAANLAALLTATGRAPEAEAVLRQAAAAKPGDADWLCALGVALEQQGRSDEAEQAWGQGLQAAPDHLRLRQNLGYLQLSRGQWREGWALHEARLAAAIYPKPDSPRWQGEALNGRQLLLIFEQGYGDAIQFSRYLPALLERAEGRVAALCRKPLLRLFSSQWPQVSWQAMGDAYPAAFPAHDSHVFSMSLPLLLAPEPWAFPPDLRADPLLREGWRERLALALGRRTIGLVWRGRFEHPFDHCRSLPSPALLEPLLADASTLWLSLQPEPTPEEIAWLARHGVLDLGSKLGDFADSAALLSELDGIVTVDTAMAHLAGALGLPCRLLLASEHVDWRWGRDGEATSWYPSMRLIRQRHGEAWEAAMARGWLEPPPLPNLSPARGEGLA